MVGRPSKLTPELQKEICDLLREGNFVETVCDYVGIDKTTFYDWSNRGDRGWKADIDGGYVEFSNAVKKAISQVETETVTDLRKGPMNWQAKAWWLERRHPDKWGNRGKSQIEHTIKDVDKLSDDELRAIIEG
jgi:hypothetical protein